MTYEVQQTRWDRLIRRVSGSIGPGSRLSETLSELFPVIDVENLPGELYLLSGTRLCWGATSVTGMPAEVPQAILFNPVDSGHLITVTQVSCSSNINDRIRFEVSQTTAGSAVATERFRDGRLITPTILPTGQVRSQSTPTLRAGQADFRVLADEGKFVSDPNGICVLSPDTKLVVGSVTGATVITVTFWWREREAQESELQF